MGVDINTKTDDDGVRMDKFIDKHIFLRDQKKYQ